MSGGQSDYFRRNAYKSEIDKYIDYIKESYSSKDEKDVLSYLTNGGWNARNNGRNLANNPFRCIEKTTAGTFTINVISPTTDWKEWIKTIGNVSCRGDDCIVWYQDKEIQFKLHENNNGYVVSIKESVLKENPRFSKLFRQVFRKATYCGICRVCETNCHNGCIKFIDGKVQITDCIHCHQCHEIDDGCLLYHSLRHPQGGGKI